MFALFSVACFAYSYPSTMKELLQQFCQENRKIEITTNETVCKEIGIRIIPQHVGKIRIVQDDYILFDDEDKGKIVISLSNIVTFCEVEK